VHREVLDACLLQPGHEKEGCTIALVVLGANDGIYRPWLVRLPRIQVVGRLASRTCAHRRMWEIAFGLVRSFIPISRGDIFVQDGHSD
jgi:hypothetical protein